MCVYIYIYNTICIYIYIYHRKATTASRISGSSGAAAGSSRPSGLSEGPEKILLKVPQLMGFGAS